MRVAIVLLLAVAWSCAGEIDPGWIATHGPAYVAQTGDTNYVPAQVFAWDAARLLAEQSASVQTNAGGAEYTGRISTGKWLEAPTSTGRMAAIAPSDDLTDVVVAPASGSPHYTDAQIAAALAAERTARAAVLAELNLTPARIADIKWWFTCADRESLSAQDKRKYDRVQKEVVKALVKLQLKALR
jgi:hypothetical protein